MFVKQLRKDTFVIYARTGLLLELERIYEEKNKRSALKSSDVLPDFFLPSSRTVSLPGVSLQERSSEPGTSTGAAVLPLCFSFSTIFHVCFSVHLTSMQASKINEILLRNASFLHVLLIFFCFANVPLLSEANIEVFLSQENKKVHAGYSVDVIACSV